ncbi:MAG: hypothetical protein AUI84_07010 [Delftia sp. 13_1_40CM_3_66_6]|nr:MAG: hypothetical protein AUI84_07010 [Delftia sp. 13_1_40CM_3_66_6]
MQEGCERMFVVLSRLGMQVVCDHDSFNCRCGGINGKDLNTDLSGTLASHCLNETMACHHEIALTIGDCNDTAKLPKSTV